MDQNFNNNRTDFLWTLIANPAFDAQPYAYNLQKLVTEYPQSGILQALFANSTNDKNLRQASVYYSPEALYKLINNPSSFGPVPSDKIIIRNGTLRGSGHKAATPPAVNGSFKTNESSIIDNTVSQFLNSPPPAEPVVPVVEYAHPMQFEPNIAPPTPLNTEVHIPQAVVETINTTPPETNAELSIEQRIANAIKDAHNALVPNAAPAPAPVRALQPVIEIMHPVPVIPVQEMPVEVVAPVNMEPVKVEPVYVAPVNIEPVNIVPEIKAPEIIVEPEVLFSSPVIAPEAFVPQETQFIPQQPVPIKVDEPLAITNPPPVVKQFYTEPEQAKKVEETPFVQNTPMYNPRETNFNQEPSVENIAPKKEVEAEPAPTDFFKFENMFGDRLSGTKPDVPLPASKQKDTFGEQAGTGRKTEYQDVAKYHDEKLPYTFLWWLNKTRREHAATYQPYVNQDTPAAPEPDPVRVKKTGDALQQQYFENIFHITSYEELDKKTEPIPRAAEPKKKEHFIIERFIKEEPQIRPQSSDKLDNENKAKKSSEDKDELVTETLASIYAEQMLYHKAIASYKKLMLKFPEKSRYFASKIEQLEKKTN